MSDTAPVPITPQEPPLYQCHKQVRAFKIEQMNWHYPTTEEEAPVPAYMLIQGEGFAVRESGDWCYKHEPSIGGYLVIYDDGYHSYSPAAAFGKGYTRL